MNQSPSPCFGSPDTLSPVCVSCAVKARCFERNYAQSDMPVLIKPRVVVMTKKQGRTRYAKEKAGMKPWERK